MDVHLRTRESPCVGAGRYPPASEDLEAGQAEPSRVDSQPQREIRRLCDHSVQLSSTGHTQHRLCCSLKKFTRTWDSHTCWAVPEGDE